MACMMPLTFPVFSFPFADLVPAWGGQFLEEVYTLVLSQVSSEFLDFQRENEKLHIQLEKKIRPDLDQMLILKDQISIKLQG